MEIIRNLTKTHENISQEPVDESLSFVIHWLRCMFVFCAIELYAVFVLFHSAYYSFLSSHSIHI